MPLPPSALVTTAGSASANSYVTLAVANQYHANRPPVGTTWDDATSDEKGAALIWATKLLDSLIDWTGWVVTETQALLWPRVGMWYRSGYYVPSDVIPVELQHATAEYARQLLLEDRAGDSDIETVGLTHLTAGPVSLTFKDSVYAKVVPDAVFHLIPSRWGSVRGRVSSTMEILRA
jgi:hypothetical protein